MKRLFICALVFLISYQLRSQTHIYLDEYLITLDPVKCNDTIEVKKNGKLFKIYIKDCRGEMYCEVYQKGLLIEKGGYINSLDTLKRYSLHVCRGDCENQREIVVFKYFQPLRDGDWFFYDFEYKKYISKTFKAGVLQDKRNGKED